MSQIQKPIHHRQIDDGRWRLGKEEMNQIADDVMRKRRTWRSTHTHWVAGALTQSDPPD